MALFPALPPSPVAVARTRIAALLLLLALIVLGLLWELLIAPTGRGTLAIKVLPLAAALPGLLRRRLYTFRWLSLLVWLYVTEGIVRAWGDPLPSQALAGLEIVLSVALFVVCALHVRLRLALGRAMAATPPGAATAPASA